MKVCALVLLATALFAVPSAEAKFSISLTVAPARPKAGQLVRLTVRTSAELPQKHGLRLFTVGPWRNEDGQTFFDIRLVRTGPAAFRAVVRFPYAGRWRLIVPNWGAPGSAYPPPLDQPVRVRPRS